MKEQRNNQYHRDTKKSWEYYEQLYANKWDNLEEMGKFLETFGMLRLSLQETDSLKRPITRSEIESVTIIIKKTPCKQKSRTRWLHWGILSNI